MLRASRRLGQKGFGGVIRCYAQKITQTASTSEPQPNPDVPGLSKNCVSVPSTPVGPGAAKDKDYKNPEYYCYHVDSFAEAEVELKKFRLPAPSNKIKFQP